MLPLEIGPNTTMGEILAAYPSAKLELFRRYHVGGCAACGYQLTDTLEQVCREHNITDPLEKVIEYVRSSPAAEAQLQILPTMLFSAIKPAQAPQASAPADVAPSELLHVLRLEEQVRLIDVRSREEWEEGHLAGAQHLTTELKFDILDSWPKDTPIIVYSNQGRRGLETASYFLAYGLTNVRNLAGGLQAWLIEAVRSGQPAELIREGGVYAAQ